MAAPLVTLGNATDFCGFVLGTSELALATTASCSVTAFSDKGPIDGWLLYASQLGYSNGHMILAVFLVAVTLASLTRMLGNYKTMLGGLDWESLSEFQNLHVLLHISTMAFSLAFLSGFATYVLNVYPAWTMLSSLTEMLLFAVQVVLTMILARLWLAEKEIKFKSLKWVALVITIPASLLYIICICSYGGRSMSADATFGQMSQFLIIIIDVIRFMLGFLGVVYVAQKHEVAYYDVNVASLTTVLSVSTCTYTILSILFTLGIFCPDIGGTWLRFYEWYYFISMSALAVYFGFNLEKLSARKENWTQLDENNDAFKREESGTLAASSPSMLTSPVRAFLERNNANETSNRTLVPEPESPLSNLRTQEDEHRKRVFTITNWIGKGLGLAVSAIYLLDLYYIRKNDVALKTCLLTTACVALGGHFLTAAFRESPPKWGKYELVPSSLFGVLFIAAVVLAVQLTEDFGLYYAFALWPVVTLIVSCDTHKAIPDSTIKMVNPDALGLERTDTLAFGQGILPPPSRQCVPLGAIAWRLTRTFNLIVIRSTWFISLIYGGLYLPLALNTILISSAVAISANLKVKNKWTYLTFLVLALVGILLSSVALSAVLPIFMTKSYNTDSIGFIQRQGKPYSQLAPVQNISGLYIDNEFSQSLGKNEEFYNEWLSGLTSLRSRVLFDVKQDLNDIKKLARPFCTKLYPFMPAFVIDDPQALLNLWKLGLNDHFLFFKQYSESQVAFEVPYGQSTAFSTIFEFRSVLLNPFIVTSSRHRNKNTLGRFSNREDSDPFISLTKLLGCTADIVRDAARAASMFPSSNNLVVGNVTLSQPNTYEPGYKSTGASLVTSWIIAVIALPVLLGSFSIVYGFYRKSVGKPLIVFDQSVYVFGRTINIQKAIEQATLLAGLFSATGWLIFVIGGGSLIAASNRTLDPAGLTFLLAVIGLTTCFFSVVSTVFRYKPFMLVHTTLVIFTLISAGHVIQAGLISDMTYQGIRLMIIGAALCSVFLAIAAGLITSRRTRMELEHDYFAQGASALCATGWILMIVAVSRMSIEAALIPQFSYIALIVSGFLGTSLVFVSTIQYNQWFSSTGIAASTLSIAFCGGVLSHSGVKMQICANSKVGCAYFWSVAFSGAFLYLVGASVCLVTRFIHSNTEEETETQAIAQLQIKDYRETLEQPSETAEGILEILRPDDEDDNFYQWLSLSQLWLPWKLCALMCFMSWTVYLGGLGSTSDSDLFSEVTTASTIFAIFAPFGLVGLVYSLIRNSRPLMATAVCVSSISMLSAGRMISVVWLNPYSSWAASLSGLSIFILFFSACISLIFFRMKLLISREEKQSQFSSRISFIVYSSLFVGIVGMIICATGVGVLYGSTDLVPFRVQPFVGIAGTVLGFLSVTMNAIAFQLLFREGMDVTGASSTDWVWPPVLMITLNLSIYLVTLLSYLPIGSMLFISAGHISNCVAGISSCTSGTMPPILVFIGVLIYIMGSLCFLTFVTLNSKAMKLDGDLFLLTPQKRELEPLTKILGDIDLYTMVLASPILQQRLKICIGLYIISFFAFIVPYGSFAVFVKLTNNVGIAIPFAVLSVATPILLSAWILVGNVVLQYASLMTILVCTCFAGYLLCWGIFFGLAYPASIAASALLYVIVTSVVLMGCLSWYSFRDTNMYFSARSKYLLGIAQAGWVLFIAGFVLQHLAVTKVIGYAEEVSGWLFVVSGFCFTGLHLLQDYEVQFIRLISYCSLGWSISFGGSVFLLALAALNSTALMTYTILKIVGSAIYVAFMIAFIIHKNIFSFIELTEQEDGQLTWKSKLSPREKELHWIHQPQFRNCLMMYFIWILLTTAGIFVLILSFVILGDVGNSLLAHSFFVAICVSLVSHVVYIYLRWEAFGWFYVLATCVASCLCGPTVSYAINVPSTSTPFAVIIGCVLAILGNTAVFALLICDMKTCDARWFMICIKTVIGLSAVGILLNIVGLAINTSIILIPAILSVSFPGICAVLYIIFIYIWRPEAPKVKSLAELFGYTIVKKKDLEDALTSNEDLNSAEKLENEEKKKKNPVFKVLIKKPKPKPIVQRKTINDWLRLLFGSQQTALSLVVFSLFVNGMTAQFMGARLQKDGSDGGNLQTYLLFLGSMLTLAALVVYIIVLAITCLIDETNVIENARPVVKEPQDMPAHRVIDDIQDVDVAELHAASIDLPKESQLPQEADLPVSSFPNEMQEVSQRTRLAEVVIEKPTSRPQAARLEHVDEYDNAGSSDDEYIPKPVPTQSNSKDPFSENYRPALQPISQPSKSPETPVEVINEGSGSKWIKKPTAQTPEPLSLEDLVEEF